MRTRVARPVHQRRDDRGLYQARPSGHGGHRTHATAHADPPGLWLSLCRGGGGAACGTPCPGAHGDAASLASHAAAGRHPLATRLRSTARGGLHSLESWSGVTRASLSPRSQDGPRIHCPGRARRRAQTGHAARVYPGPGHGAPGACGTGCTPPPDAYPVHPGPTGGPPLWRDAPPRGRHAPPGPLWRPGGPGGSRPAGAVGRLGAAPAVGGIPERGRGCGVPSSGGHPNWPPCTRSWRRWSAVGGKPWGSWGSPAWASRGSSRSGANSCPRTG